MIEMPFFPGFPLFLQFLWNVVGGRLVPCRHPPGEEAVSAEFHGPLKCSEPGNVLGGIFKHLNFRQ